jgi:hypothetical protein
MLHYPAGVPENNQFKLKWRREIGADVNTEVNHPNTFCYDKQRRKVYILLFSDRH